MCGINGFNFRDQRLIEEMVESTKHRGPDGSGFYVDDRLSLGHNLLAITDTPTDGRQPFFSPDKNYVLIYNGEIYNYKKLKTELETNGCKFRTQGDTEVLLCGLIEEGVDFVKKLNGMFAFAFLNKKAGKLYLARDRMGMKPLYYYYKDGKFIFSSEVKGILNHQIEKVLDYDALSVFFQLGYLPGQRTLIKDTFKIRPGEYLEFNLADGKLTNNWFADSSDGLPAQSFDKSYFYGLMGDSVTDHTMGLRPFGMYLSGGLDSSVVFYELLNHGISNLKTYTTRFEVSEPRFNEDADVAARLSKDFNTNHHELFISEKNFIDAIFKTVETIEEPRYHPSIPAYYLMAEYVSKELVVILTGDGGDELFMGYPKYYESARMSRRYKKYPDFLLSIYHSLNNFRKGRIPLGMYLPLNKVIERWWYLSRIMSRVDNNAFRFKNEPTQVIKYLYSTEMPATKSEIRDMENGLAELDRLFWLSEDSFLITDKLGMRFGMEARFPFSDRRIVGYGASISSEEKLKAPGSKGLMRQTYKDKLPDYVVKKRKSGWTAPVIKWMDSYLGKVIKDVCSPDFYSESAGLFNFDYIKKRFRENKGNFTQQDAKFIFPIFTFQIWAEQLKIRV